MPTPRRTPERRAPDDAAVAWGLAAAAHPHLSRADVDRIYIAIGIGEVFEAIDALITVIARDRISLDSDLVATVDTWLDCYRGRAPKHACVSFCQKSNRSSRNGRDRLKLGRQDQHRWPSSSIVNRTGTASRLVGPVDRREHSR